MYKNVVRYLSELCDHIFFSRRLCTHQEVASLHLERQEFSHHLTHWSEADIQLLLTVNPWPQGAHSYLLSLLEMFRSRLVHQHLLGPSSSMVRAPAQHLSRLIRRHLSRHFQGQFKIISWSCITLCHNSFLLEDMRACWEVMLPVFFCFFFQLGKKQEQAFK